MSKYIIIGQYSRCAINDFQNFLCASPLAFCPCRYYTLFVVSLSQQGSTKSMGGLWSSGL
jgi:hypothetical protein